MRTFKKAIDILTKKGFEPEYAVFCAGGPHCINPQYFFIGKRGIRIARIFENGVMLPNFEPLPEYDTFYTWGGEKIMLSYESFDEVLYSLADTGYREWKPFEWNELIGKRLLSAREVDLSQFEEVMNPYLDEYRPREKSD